MSAKPNFRGYYKLGQTKKMGNEPTACALGHSHASKLESSVCQDLQLRMKAGEIKSIKSQDHVYLTAARILYISDFKCETYDELNPFFWAEAKGYANDRWPTIRKLWKYYGPGKLEIWKGTYRNPTLDETISPITNHYGAHVVESESGAV